jgi:ketosteroid isomerase-like protein
MWEQSMKRCPTCQRTYADDSLRFCLQDGTALVSVTDTPPSYDPSATLVLGENATSHHEPPPTEAFSPQTAQTLPSQKSAPTAPPQPTRPTARDGQEAIAHPPSSQSSALVIGLTVTVAVLLLALGSVGAWMLLRDERGDEKKEARIGDNQNNTAPTANSNERASSNASVSSNVTLTPTPSPTATTTTPRVDTAAIREQVTAALNGWAAASMARDIDRHMSYYADMLDIYYSANGVSAARVRSDRERAYAIYSTINIQLSKISVTVDQPGERANATFDKTWNFEGSKHSSGSVQQRIWLAKMGGRWRITGEKDLKVYYVDN